MKNNCLIKVEHLSKEYLLGKTPIPALRNISLTIEKQDFLVIAGSSGSGKTTLLNIIGLIDNPTSGEVWFGTDKVSSVSLNSLFSYRRDRLGYIFQTFNLIPVMSVFENVEYPLVLKKVQKKSRQKRVEQVLDKVGLGDRKNHKPRELSGGQRQRVSIARAMVKTPDIVLADEPTANLDSRTGREIVELMQTLNQEEGAIFIFSSHDPGIIDQGQKILFLQDGEIVDSKNRRVEP
ncbi:MAG: ABC transporter ATP-binding protein [bacterium]